MNLENVDLVGFLHRLCDAAKDETLPRFRQRIVVENKLSGTFDPVTMADKAAEDTIRRMIKHAFPDHGIIGEEQAAINHSARQQWIIDPIDGTRAFISGIPVWGTLIAYMVDRVPVMGMMDQPFTGERYFSNGEQTWLDHGGVSTMLTTSAVNQLCNATVLTTSPKLFAGERLDQYEAIEQNCQLARYGLDCYGYCMVASGHADLAVESGLNIYDIAALIPIVEHAGGIVTDWQGKRLTQGGDVVAAANRELHAEALEVLNR